MKPFLAADLFCGAGGTSTGMAQACSAAGRRVRIVAVNHCEDLTTMDPRKAVPASRFGDRSGVERKTNHQPIWRLK